MTTEQIQNALNNTLNLDLLNPTVLTTLDLQDKVKYDERMIQRKLMSRILVLSYQIAILSKQGPADTLYISQDNAKLIPSKYTDGLLNVIIDENMGNNIVVKRDDLELGFELKL